jgi:hypothetical protein
MSLYNKTRLTNEFTLDKDYKKSATAAGRHFSYLDASITLLLPESKLETITIWSFPMVFMKSATFFANETIIPYIGNGKLARS